MNRFDRLFWSRLWTLARPYWQSDRKLRALGLMALTLVLSGLILAGGLVFSYVARDMMTALAERNGPVFFRTMLLLVVYNLIAGPVVAIAGYVTGKLMLDWRQWLTERFLETSFHDRTFYRISEDTSIDNPDQRISEDVNTFVGFALSFVTQVFQGVATGASFIVVLWLISPFLAFLLAVCVGGGSLLTIVIGRPLIGINFAQRRLEADFRYALVGLRDNAEAIAFYGAERREHQALLQRLYAAIRNLHRLIARQRNLAFFTYGYDYLLPLIPVLALAPAFFAGTIEFGKITQASAAFITLRASFSIIIDQFNSLSSFAAVVERLGEYLEASPAPNGRVEPVGAAGGGGPVIETVEAARLAIERLTLHTPDRRRTLVRDLSLELTTAGNLLIVGESGVGKTSILRAIAGLWRSGSGRIVRPPLSDLMFVPQRPHMITGSLRDQLCYPHAGTIGEDQLIAILKLVGLDSLPQRIGGFDAQVKWDDLLSLGEQQQIAFARLLFNRPAYAFLDEATSALDTIKEEALYGSLTSARISLVSVGDRLRLPRYHRTVLELLGDGGWRLTTSTTVESPSTL
ncbi:MAG TPA: ABC transporter ATP-binding protein/permease, partial [Candidatus Polarisedimenticolia bacterium]|nr:ABC transporter ATP-binding protein/permease [Candidatus Polarisedimenticolia bacterium]